MTGAVACLTVLSASYFSGYVAGIWEGYDLFLAIIGLGTATLAVLVTVLDDSRAGDGHATCCAAYTNLCEDCRTLLATIEDKMVDEQVIMRQINDLTSRYGEAAKLSADYPTSKKDYDIAKKGLASGEEEYTDAELGASGL